MGDIPLPGDSGSPPIFRGIKKWES